MWCVYHDEYVGGLGGLVVWGMVCVRGVPVLRYHSTCLGLGWLNFCRVTVGYVGGLGGMRLKYCIFFYVTVFYLMFYG